MFRRYLGTNRGMPNASIKDEKVYKEVRKSGASKEKAARVANASARDGRSAVAKRGGKGGDYEDRTKGELLAQARKVGIEGRSKMNKRELIQALRNH
jgi:hypothetical protein